MRSWSFLGGVFVGVFFAAALAGAVRDFAHSNMKMQRDLYAAVCQSRGDTQEVCRREAAYWQVYGEGK